MTDELREKFMEFQMLQKHMEHMNEQVQMLHQQIVEVDISMTAIEEIGKVEVGNEVLAPVANGIFIKTKLDDNAKLIVNVGSNTTVERTPAEIVSLLEEQKSKMSAKITEAEALMQDFSQQAMKIYEQVEKAQEKDVQN